MNTRKISTQRGLSLIELMIALLLSTLLLFGVLQIFDANRDTMRMTTAFARVQESGRFAVDLLTREIRMADYWGCAPDLESIENHLKPSDPIYQQNPDIFSGFGGNGVLGRDNVEGAEAEVNGATAKAGSDILILSGADDACGGIGRMVPSDSSASMFVAESCPVEAGQIALVANCQYGDMFTITNVGENQGQGAKGKKTITHNTGNPPPGSIQNGSKDITNEYGADARILLPYRRTFFIAESAGDSGGFSLYMTENGKPNQELVPGIENMQIHYGRDSSGDNTVDIWSSADGMSAAEMEQVLAVKVELQVASDIRVGADKWDYPDLDGNPADIDDGRLRKVYLTTAKIRNRGRL